MEEGREKERERELNLIWTPRFFSNKKSLILSATHRNAAKYGVFDNLVFRIRQK
jgi:hypothetical protein